MVSVRELSAGVEVDGPFLVAVYIDYYVVVGGQRSDGKLGVRSNLGSGLQSKPSAYYHAVLNFGIKSIDY